MRAPRPATGAASERTRASSEQTGAASERTRASRSSTRASPSSIRARRVIAVTVAVAIVVAAVALVWGSYQTSAAEVWEVLVGSGTPRTELVVLDLRLPRVVVGAAVGAGLGLAGAVFQSLSRNPLGSPDIVGFSAGSAAGALVCLVLVVPPVHPAIGAWAGGIVAVGVVLYLTGGGGLARDRTIIAGIALSALLASVSDYLLTRAPTEVARSATTWLFGSLSGTGWGDVWPLLAGTGALSVLMLLRRRSLRVLELGDDLAAVLGENVGRSRLILLLAAAGLTGTAVAAAGPIGFVALAAPQIARRTARFPGVPLAASMAMGAALLLVADVAGQRLLAPLQIPVGLVTGAVGGAYLFWLVTRRMRAAG